MAKKTFYHEFWPFRGGWKNFFFCFRGYFCATDLGKPWWMIIRPVMDVVFFGKQCDFDSDRSFEACGTAMSLSLATLEITLLAAAVYGLAVGSRMSASLYNKRVYAGFFLFVRARCFDLDDNVARCSRVWSGCWVPDVSVSLQETCVCWTFFSVATVVLITLLDVGPRCQPLCASMLD